MIEHITQFIQSHSTISSFSSIAGGGAAVLLLANCWKYIVGAFNTMRNCILSRSAYTHDASNAMLSYIMTYGIKLRIGIRAYSGSRHFINPIQRVESLAFEDITNEPTVVLLHGRLLVVKRGDGEQSIETNTLNNEHTEYNNTIQVTTIRGWLDLDKLMIKAMTHFNQLHQVSVTNDKNRRRFRVERLGKHADSGASQPGRGYGKPGQVATEIEHNFRINKLRLLRWNPMDVGVRMGANSAFNVFFYPEPVMHLVNEIRSWLKCEKWFKDKGIPWRLGCLFYGKPGTGKSTLINSIAMELDLPVFVLDLSAMDNASLTESWKEVQQSAPAIALIEDIDSIFDKRENIGNSNITRDTLTYDCLLNTISGVGNSDGVLLCVTTNDLSKLDDALGLPSETSASTRPGRIDRAIELIDMQDAERRKVATHVLKDYPDIIEDVIKAGQGETAAQFQARCTTLALSQFWKNNKLS